MVLRFQEQGQARPTVGALQQRSGHQGPRVGSPPPIDLLCSYRARPLSALNVFKATRAALVWRNHHGLAAIALLAGYVGWLSRFPSRLFRQLLRHGASASRQHGRHRFGQVADLVKVAIVNGVMPKDYYFAGLARYGGSDDIFRYIPTSLYNGTLMELARELDPAMVELAKDKISFERRCRNGGIPVAETVAIVKQGEVWGPDGRERLATLPTVDLIIKPARGRNGIGVELWRWDGSAYQCPRANCIVTSTQLLNRAMAESRGKPAGLLIQKRLANSPELAWMAGSALATTRFVTILDERAEPEIVDCFYRTSSTPEAAADNFHAGGVLFPVDLVTGRLHFGFTDGPWPPSKITHHPISGINMVGIGHPGWQAMHRLVLDLHRFFPTFLVVGWDIAFTPSGAVVLEANACPEVSINRQGSFDGLVGTRLFDLLAWHAARWLETCHPAGPPWRRRQRSAV